MVETETLQTLTAIVRLLCKSPQRNPSVIDTADELLSAESFKTFKVFSGPYFPAFGLKTDAGKYGPEKTPYLDNFHTVSCTYWHYILPLTCRKGERNFCKVQNWVFIVKCTQCISDLAVPELFLKFCSVQQLCNKALTMKRS